jgi:hypothetical protein
MIKKITLLFILFSFIFICSQHQKLSYLPEEIFGKQPKPSAYKKFKINDEKNKFSTYYINNYKKLPIKRVPEEKIKSQAKDLIVDVQKSLNYLNQNFKNDSVIFDQNLGNKIAEIKNIDKNWIIDHYFQELYFYESAIKKREQEKIWNANYIAKRKQDSVIREKRIRFTDSLRLVRTQKYQPKNAPKKVVTQK